MLCQLIAEISEQVGVLTVKNESAISPYLCRDNQIRTIHSSLAIENNLLSLEQVTNVINGKRILGASNEICEVKNAYEAYNLFLPFDLLEIDDLLKAHKILMLDLTNESDRFRSGRVGVFAGEELIYMAPPTDLVPKLIGDLLNWVKTADAHPLIKLCISL